MTNEIIQWGFSYLSSQGYTLKNNLPENVKDTPWSYLVRFATTDGFIYLKHTPHQLALEANIIQILHDQFHAPVPEVIASNPELDSFLMKDAGTPLRGLLKKKFDPALLCKAVVISHPLFSLINFLHQTKKHHALKDEDDAYQQIMDACLKSYMNVESKKRLLDAIAIAEILLFVYGALAGYRLMIACGKEKLMSLQPGKFSNELRQLLNFVYRPIPPLQF